MSRTFSNSGNAASKHAPKFPSSSAGPATPDRIGNLHQQHHSAGSAFALPSPRSAAVPGSAYSSSQTSAAPQFPRSPSLPSVSSMFASADCSGIDSLGSALMPPLSAPAAAVAASRETFADALNQIRSGARPTHHVLSEARANLRRDYAAWLDAYFAARPNIHTFPAEQTAGIVAVPYPTGALYNSVFNEPKKWHAPGASGATAATAAASSGGAGAPAKLFIGGLSPRCTDKQIKAMVKIFGGGAFCWGIDRKTNGGKSKSAGCCTLYVHESDADAVITGVHKRVLLDESAFVFAVDEVRAYPPRVQAYLGFHSMTYRGEQPGFLWRVRNTPLEEVLGLAGEGASG